MKETISLKELYDRTIEQEKSSVAKTKIKDEKKYYLNFLSLENTSLAICKMFLEKDFASARNHFYKAAMSNAYSHEMKYYPDSFMSWHEVFYPLLSDNKALIKRYLTYDNIGGHPAWVSVNLFKAVQAVLSDDKEKLAKSIEGLEKKIRTGKGGEKKYFGVVTFFNGFLEKDSTLIKAGILEVLSTHKKQDHPAVTKDYINLVATGLAKLAWIKGYEIEIYSPLVPKEILPIKELEHYEGYEFF